MELLRAEELQHHGMQKPVSSKLSAECGMPMKANTFQEFENKREKVLYADVLKSPHPACYCVETYWGKIIKCKKFQMNVLNDAAVSGLFVQTGRLIRTPPLSSLRSDGPVCNSSICRELASHPRLFMEAELSGQRHAHFHYPPGPQ